MESPDDSENSQNKITTWFLSNITRRLNIAIASFLFLLYFKLVDTWGDWLLYLGGFFAILFVISFGIRTYKKKQREHHVYVFYEQSIQGFSKLTYRQRFAITEYGYLLSPENAEVVGKMLANSQDDQIIPFCQANGKQVLVEK